MTSPNTFLQGSSLYLRGLLDDDALGPYPSWFNDAEVCAGNSHHVLPYDSAQATEYIRRVRGSTTELVLAIVVAEGEKHIGNISLSRIDYLSRSAQFAIVVGDRSAWNKGFSKEAARLLCDHGFSALNLRRIECGTFESNTAMRRLALWLGMKEEGVRREAAYKNGEYVNVIEFGMLRSEYFEKMSGV